MTPTTSSQQAPPEGYRISLVVPAFNEELELPGLLESIAVAKQNYHRGPAAVQVVVADNASTDRTAELAGTNGCTVVPVTRRSIACARNGGARAAEAPVLAFVDADSRINPATFNAIEETLSPTVVVGATGIRMSRSSLGIAITMFVVNAVTRIGRAGPGVIFCRHNDWEEVGGFDESRRYAEDVKFQFDLKRLGRDRGQGFAWAEDVPAITSARKFDRFGDWHAFGLVWKWALGPAAFERFVQRYWYDPER